MLPVCWRSGLAKRAVQRLPFDGMGYMRIARGQPTPVFHHILVNPNSLHLLSWNVLPSIH